MWKTVIKNSKPLARNAICVQVDQLALSFSILYDKMHTCSRPTIEEAHYTWVPVKVVPPDL